MSIKRLRIDVGEKEYRYIAELLVQGRYLNFRDAVKGIVYFYELYHLHGKFVSQAMKAKKLDELCLVVESCRDSVDELREQILHDNRETHVSFADSILNIQRTLKNIQEGVK